MASFVDPAVMDAILAKSSPSTRTTRTKVHYISAADTAKLIRSALRISLRNVPFSVRARSYSGGSSVDVRWTDGPTTDHVDGVLAGFVGKGFDGMIDLAYSSDCFYKDGRVGFSATRGTGGSVPAVSVTTPDDAAILVFLPWITTSRSYSTDHKLVDSGDYATARAAYHALCATPLPAAPAPKY